MGNLPLNETENFKIRICFGLHLLFSWSKPLTGIHRKEACTLDFKTTGNLLIKTP